VIIAIRFFDMFSGIGGFRSGLEQAGGFECVGFCEIDHYAESAYRAIYDTEGEIFYSDIAGIDTSEMPDFDLLVGGFPCQSFAGCGLRKGFDDPRGALFFELARIIGDKRPAAFLLENVKGLIVHNQGATYKKILLTLSELGYIVEWRVLNTRSWLPQERKRVYIVGHHRADRAGEIFNFEERGGADLCKIIGGTQGQRVYDSCGIACTQCAGDGGQGVHTGLYTVDMNSDPKLLDYIRCIVARYDSGITNFKGTSSGVLVEMSPRVIDLADKSEFFESERTAYAVVVVDENGKERYFRIRKLMPLESWRAQGFTTEQFNKAAALGICDSRLYKMSGNSVSVPVIKAIGERIRDIIFDGGEKSA
jgi:DNA (cytosine-5)-methyltransferase 1